MSSASADCMRRSISACRSLWSMNALEGGGRDHEARRGPQAERFLTSPRLAILLPTASADSLVSRSSGRTSRRRPAGLRRVRISSMRAWMIVEPGVQLRVLPGREFSRFGSCEKTLTEMAVQAGADEGHAEGPRPVKGLLHFGHDLQRLVVGGEQQLEVVIAFAELNAKRIRCLPGFRRLAGQESLDKTRRWPSGVRVCGHVPIRCERHGPGPSEWRAARTRAKGRKRCRTAHSGSRFRPRSRTGRLVDGGSVFQLQPPSFEHEQDGKPYHMV